MYKYDGVDAPPDGVAMCQDGAEAIKVDHRREECTSTVIT
jgi:hypothetical protein